MVANLKRIKDIQGDYLEITQILNFLAVLGSDEL